MSTKNWHKPSKHKDKKFSFLRYNLIKYTNILNIFSKITNTKNHILVSFNYTLIIVHAITQFFPLFSFSAKEISFKQTKHRELIRQAKESVFGSTYFAKILVYFFLLSNQSFWSRTTVSNMHLVHSKSKIRSGDTLEYTIIFKQINNHKTKDNGLDKFYSKL